MLLLATLSALAIDTGSAEPETLENLLAGTFSNEEHAYFEADANRTPPPWMSFRISSTDDGMTLQSVDAYGKETDAPQPITIAHGRDRDILALGNCERFFERDGKGWKLAPVQNRKLCHQDYQIASVTQNGITLRLANGEETLLKRARPVECWAAVKKVAPKPDGSADWLFAQKLELHDQGGRVLVGGGDTGTDPLILRMRAVYWPKPSTNRPSMVLYVHKPENPDKAVSYSWADIDASRVGMNLRWMQASCTIVGAERSSEVNPDNFRG